MFNAMAGVMTVAASFGVGLGESQDSLPRDPFVEPALVVDEAEPRRKASGLAGFVTEQLLLRGVLRSRKGHRALLLAPDSRTYIGRPADRLRDGVIESVSGQGIAIRLDARAGQPSRVIRLTLPRADQAAIDAQ